jgi:hypothetical protein
MEIRPQLTILTNLDNTACTDLIKPVLPTFTYIIKMTSTALSRRIRSAGHVARMGEGRNMYRVLVGNPEGKRPF